MTKFYVIVPLVLLALFLGFERNFEKRRKAEEDVRALAADAKKRADDLAQWKREQVAAADTLKRTEERERQERERADKKRHDYEAMIATLKAQAEQQSAEAEKLAAELSTLATQLAESRSKRNTTERETFELACEVELQRADRRSAEMELQRTTTMIAARLEESRWANPTPAPHPSPR